VLAIATMPMVRRAIWLVSFIVVLLSYEVLTPAMTPLRRRWLEICHGEIFSG
jgi:hypothetical protein